jgi:oligosaccharide reducing-end xylanase
MGGGTGGGTGVAGSGTAGTAGAFSHPTDPCAPRTGYRNLFTEYLNKSQAEVDAKLDAGFKQLFHGGSGENLYFTTGTDEAYIQDVNNNDVRSEGMSYGMTVAVQLDKKEEFNRLWKWTKRVMYQASSGYFAWQASTSGQVISNASAPDGEEYFATALILASQRWGDGTGINNYSGEAKALLTAMTSRGLFNRSNYLVTFGPSGAASGYTDPSYMLPAFYQIWACWDTQNQAFWRSAISASRAFFPKTVHATTGLAPYLANFDGTPRQDGGEGPTFNSDSWRVVGNIMMDHHFYGADPWQTQWAPKYAAFMKTALAMRPVPDKFELDGRVRSSNNDASKGLVAQNALVGFGLPAADGAPFVQALWDMEIPVGQYRYYDGMLYLLAMLHVSGKFKLDY